MKIRQGRGLLRRSNGVSYDGYFKDNKFHGKGKLSFALNDSQGRKHYIGCFEDGTFHGHGTMYLQNGDSYKANWIHDTMQSAGKFQSFPFLTYY